MKKLFLFLLPALIFSCSANTNNTSHADSIGLNYKNIPEERTTTKPKPVQTYSETIKSFETTDEFTVSLFETKETFHYLIKIQYKQLEEEDTLRVPNFGIEPSVKIIKGETRPSCIVGFLDEKKEFRESKLIYFKDNSLKVHVLKYYGVYQSQ